MSASALPDPKDISYDVLLRCVPARMSLYTWANHDTPSQIMAYLDLFGEFRPTLYYLC